VQVELLAALNRNEQDIGSCPVSAINLGELIARIIDKSISGKIAKQVFETMWSSGDSADASIQAQGLEQVSDSGALESMVAEGIAANRDQVGQYAAADEGKRKKLLGFFVGQIMKASKGQANPQMINEILTRQLDEAAQGETGA